ncbi:hydantoinase/oxoprolinase family protein [Petroclostridium sp. X23]|uniref:hydantoinase/oxoprolinase family protein n=1 Tax=Petroclostridium sp. X23 TaxID=3045146 RepID=UPI0024ACA352|nr:hydantoinase/oxoprolinase family protein [Petroclostridium sp. X23]WHH56859.1 hydantoinase/oxoprolinase family protein [Petroclostridium sp. X23]
MFKLKLGVDVGGTFTDVVGISEEGKVYFAKMPSTPQDQSIGVLNGIKSLLSSLEVPADCVTGVAHGTTVATNTLLERNGAVTALITTKGFRDVLHIGRQSRPELYDLHARKPEPLIPRYLRREADERTLHTGAILANLDVNGLKQTVQELMKEGVESIAVCFLHSYVNAKNECKALKAIREIAPDFPVSVSSEILPEFREFERMNTTVINAYVQPRMQRYVSQLRGRLDENGMSAPLTIMQSSGGMMTDQVAASRSVNTLLSGPAGGVLAAEFLSKITPYHNIITGDLGGTSFDVAVVQNGNIDIASEGMIEGFHVKFPHIDITTIGAGGGSIAWLDVGGALRVGPRSAGAVPGPVCYSKGGIDPTVTDAHAVLGRVGGELLGGKMKLDVPAARAAIEEKLAKNLNMIVEEVAEGILRVANANMVRAIRVMTVEKGIDPRKFVLLPYGGAGALHAVDLARTLEIPTVVIPIAPGNFSAFGLLVAPIRYDEVCTYRKHQKDISYDCMEQLFQQLEKTARQEMARDEVAEDTVTFRRKADIRYFGQAYELTIPLPNQKIDEHVWKGLLDDFSTAHEQSYGFKKENDPIEVVSLRLSVVGRADNDDLYAKGERGDGKVMPVTIRKVYFMGKWMEAGIYNRDLLKVGDTFVGPAIVEETGATSVIGPSDKVVVDERKNLIIEVADNASCRAAVDASK